MDEDGLKPLFRDDLGVAIEAATTVAPAADFTARVRRRIDRERVASSNRVAWALPVVAIAAAACLAVAVTLVRESADSGRAPATTQLMARPIGVVTPMARAIQSAALHHEMVPAPVSQPPRVSAEAARLRAYVEHIRRATPSAHLAHAGDPIELAEIAIERIEIEPLPKRPTVSGDRR